MYLALYRKYRPRTFDDVISQEHITTTLKNQVKNGQTAHAYLFTGSRGTGKTTCAKILAMAMNCLSPKDGNPCLECERCRDILDGSCTDIVEMDAASNRGVDDVRTLRDEVAYLPVSCKYRVYIIDEVHMLTAEAFNALLKTLEEPPPHVKFILATTELHKVLPTISSRCQRFEFRRIDVKDSSARLEEVAQKENVQLDHDAAELISRLSDGGMRDALSLLDRCASADNHITCGVVRDNAGVADDQYIYKFSEMIAQGDTAGCIRQLRELHNNSKDLAIVIDELSGHFRDLMLIKAAPDSTDLLNALPEMHGELKRIAEMYALPDILRCMTLLRECADSMGRSRQRATIVEMCFVKMCTGAVPESAARPSVRASSTARSVPEPPLKARPDNELSSEALAKIKRTREISERSAKLISDAPPSSEVSKPVVDSVPEMFIPPINDDYIPPASDEEPYYSEISEPAPTKKSERTETKKTNTPAEEKKSGESSDLPELKSIDQQIWEEAVAKMKFPTSAMFKGSKVVMENGFLVITSSNKMLLNNVKDEELLRLENDISILLGARAKIEIRAGLADGQKENASPIDELIARAKAAGIEVTVVD